MKLRSKVYSISGKIGFGVAADPSRSDMRVALEMKNIYELWLREFDPIFMQKLLAQHYHDGTLPPDVVNTLNLR